MSLTFYDELGVPASATTEEIKTAYRNLAKRYHPDVCTEEPPTDATGTKYTIEGRFQRIAKAYEVLSDPERRRNYDTCGLELSADERKARCHGALAEVMATVLDAEWSPNVELLTAVRQSIVQKQTETYKANRKDMAQLAKYEKHKKGLVFKGEGPSPVLIAVNMGVERLHGAINVHKANLILYADMLELLKSYEMDHAAGLLIAPAPASTTAQP